MLFLIGLGMCFLIKIQFMELEGIDSTVVDYRMNLEHLNVLIDTFSLLMWKMFQLSRVFNHIQIATILSPLN